ncbi:MAG: site-specific integrase [Eubacterium sp.]|jgi:integrase|nr:site-specific integrase [Eubacterium sp.]MCH4047443.1 site-specific integrase [Eubacterium sp.]MCI1308125.1 site-specific integrase [Eubacterium sp.]MCI1406603.1 site-specific integrase [Eubacterium sp.]MCI1429084.1 site-specific integrase [Eubacterium sp.]
MGEIKGGMMQENRGTSALEKNERKKSQTGRSPDKKESREKEEKRKQRKQREIRRMLKEERRRWDAQGQNSMKLEDLYHEYMRVYAPYELKPSTMRVYEVNLKNHVLPAFGKMKLSEIDNRILSLYFCKFYNDRPTIARNAFHALCSVMKFGVRMHYLLANPCSLVILPKKGLPEEKRRYLTMEEIPDFLALFQGNETIDTLVPFLLLTGMRVGEACALQWQDVDIAEGEIMISRSVYVAKGSIAVGLPKSKSSTRKISIGKQVIRLLKHQWNVHARELREAEISGEPLHHPDLIFSRKHGDYICDSAVWHAMKKRVNGTPFSFMTPHCLRHTNATLLLNQGVDLKIVSEHLGHTSIRVTADVYTDVLKSSHKKTAELVESAITEAEGEAVARRY